VSKLGCFFIIIFVFEVSSSLLLSPIIALFFLALGLQEGFSKESSFSSELDPGFFLF